MPSPNGVELNRLRVSLHGAEIQTLDLVEGREYLVGRNSDCDIRLETHSGISRVHVRLRHDGQNWIAEVVSKFGKIMRDGSSVPSVELAHGASFQVHPYDFIYEDAEQIALKAGPSDSTSSAMQLRAYSTVPATLAPADFDGNDEATAIGALRLAAFLRILPGLGRSEQEIRLDGGPWIAGRDEEAAIFINDPKASRRQFEIAQTSKGWLIKDLGSSNGTTVNGATLPPNELIPLRSGDVIGVQTVELIFEARDVTFAQRAAALPVVAPLVLPSEQHAPQQYGQQYGSLAAVDYRQPSLPAPIGDGGAIVYNPNGDNGGYGGGPVRLKLSPVSLFALVGLAAVLLAWLFSSGSEAPPPVPLSPAASKFAAMQPNERKRIEGHYRRAQDFLLREEPEMALRELETIHKVLPEGYEDSLTVKANVEDLKRVREEQAAIVKEKERLRREDDEVAAIIAQCRPQSIASSDSSAIRRCLDHAIQLRPDNPEIQAMIDKADRRKAEAEAEARNQSAYRGSIARGREMHLKAMKLLNSGRRNEAIAEFQKHIRSKFPDPEGLKAKSQAEVASLRAQIEADCRTYVDQAERALQRGDFRGALEAAVKAKAIDPDHARANQIGQSARQQLNAQLEAIYTDSVMDENYGQLDAAKEKWRKILSSDRLGGEYWNKATNKLNSYSGGTPGNGL